MFVPVILSLIFVTKATDVVTYRFSTAVSKAFWDYSGNDKHGVNGMKSATVETTVDVSLTSAGAYFSGGQRVTLPPNDLVSRQVTIGSNFSMLFWVNYSSGPNKPSLIEKYDTATAKPIFSVCFDSDRLKVQIEGNSNNISVNFVAGQWFLITIAVSCTTTACTITGFKNAASSASTTMSNVITDKPEIPFILGDSVPNASYVGYMYEFRLVDKTLAMTDVATYIGSGCTTCATTSLCESLSVCLPLPAVAIGASFCSDLTKCGTLGCVSLATMQCFAVDMPKCYSSCFTCLGPGISDCSSCRDAISILSAGKCLCPDGYYRNSSTYLCTLCLPTCLTCVNGSTLGCTGCKTNATLAGTSPNSCDCNTGYYPSTTPANCLACDPTCTICSAAGVSNCNACFPNAMLLGGASPSSCVCSTGFYPNITSTNCLACDPTCLNCISGTAKDCSSCKANATLTGTSLNSCVCNIGFYPSTTSENCLACDPTCLNCISGTATNCSSCKTNAMLFGGTSPSSCVCSTGFYPSTTSANCLACDPTCLNCISATAKDCSSCKANAMLFGGTSPSSCVCSTGFYPSTTSANCLACDPTCLNCISGAAKDCSSCKTNATLAGTPPNSCACNTGYNPSTTSANCVACDTTCKTCSAAGVSNCITCFSNAMLFGGASPSSCVCSTGFYPSTTSANCLACDPTCLNCTNATAKDCSSCKANATLAGSPPNSCACNTGYNPSTTSANCVACDQTCKICSIAGVSGCTSCFPNAVLLSGSTSSCVCVTGYYPNLTSSNCSACSITCLQCTTAGVNGCSQCKSNAQLNVGNPGPCECSTGFYPSPDASSCVACDVVCLKCINSGTSNCTGCKVNASLTAVAPSSCICNSGYFGAPSSCQSCFATCKSCSGAASSQCTACYPNASLSPSPSTCLCNTGYFPNTTSASCSQCDLSCLTCVGPSASQCSTCPANSSLTGSAPSSCPCNTGFNRDPLTSLCNTGCSSSCSTCTAFGTDKCSSCKVNAELQGSAPSACICSIWYYPNITSANCSLCDSSCLSCAGSGASQCLSCKTNATLLGTSPSSCVCAAGTYPNPSAAACGVCSANCVTCSAFGTDKCQSCPSGLVLAGPSPNSCVCASGFYQSGTSCSPCSSPCVSCSGGTKADCTACGTNSKLAASSPSSCVCVSGYYLSSEGGSCVQCASLCVACSSAVLCSACQTNSSIVSGLCQCNTGFYLSGNLCASCDSSCATCSSTGCLTCKANNHLSDSTCVCDSGYTRDATTKECQKQSCDAGCVSCSTTGQCGGCFPNAEMVTNSTKCTCRNGYYANQDAAHCAACNLQCMTCLDGTNQGCTSCKTNAKLQNGIKSACVCKDGFYPNTDSTNCAQCVTNCKTCSNSDSCQVCMPDFYLTTLKMCKVCPNCNMPLLASVSGPISSDYSLSFNRYVTKNFTKDDFALHTAPESPISWSIFSNLTLRVSGGPWANITAVLIDFVTPVVCEFGFPLNNTHLSVTPPLDPVIYHNDSFVNTTMATAATVTVAVVGGGAAAVVVSAGGGSVAMALLSQMQYFSYIGTANYSMTGTMNNFYTNLNQKSTIPNVFKRSNNQVPIGRRLDNIEELIVVNDFLDSSGQYLTLLGGIISVHLLLFLLNVALRRRFRWLQSLTNSFRYSVYLHFWYFAYLDLQVSALLQLRNSGFSGSSLRVVVCEVMSVLALLTTGLTPILLFWFIRSKAEQLIGTEENILKQRFSPLVSSLRTDVRWAKYLVPVYYFQRLIYSLFIVFMRGRPLIQSLMLIIPCGMMALFTLITRPLIFKATRILHIIAEIDTLIVFILLCFATMQYNTPEIDICWVVVAFTLKSFICTVLIVLYELVTAIRKACQKKPKETGKVYAVTTESIIPETKDFRTEMWADQTDISFGGPNEHMKKIHPFVVVSDPSKDNASDSAAQTRRSERSDR